MRACVSELLSDRLIRRLPVRTRNRISIPTTTRTHRQLTVTRMVTGADVAIANIGSAAIMSGAGTSGATMNGASTNGVGTGAAAITGDSAGRRRAPAALP
jgi:hypothetical protein